MAGYYTESNYENAVLQLLNEGLGYTYVYGPDVERDYHSPLYEDVLLPALQRINKGLPLDAINEAIYKLKNFESGSLLQKNMTFTDYLQNGISVKYFVNGEERSTLVYLVDFKNPANNDFTVANQWTFIENSEKRPDVILFINGLPLVVVELKSPSREETDASDAYRQLRNYMYEIPSMFIYNEVCVMSDMTTSKAGTITSGEDRFMEWKTTDGSYENTQYAAFDTFFEGLFEKNRFLDILKNFICFNVDGEKTFKVLAAYHQYFAVKKAIASTQKATVTDGKGGVFWHTQGSGKSLSMVFYAHYLQEALESPTIVVITDRNDLDDQLYGQFARCKDFLRQTPQHAQSRTHLKELLANRQANGIIFTTMQKFEESGEPLSERRNIIVMADEAHRSQYGLTEKVVVRQKEDGEVEAKTIIGTARIIRDTLPNATYIGFTGTPISSKDRSTREVFGDYIDINEKMRYDYTSIYNLPEYIPPDSMTQLSADGVNFVRKSSKKLCHHVIEINKLIADRINNCKKLFPLWLNWQYVKNLFVMPNGLTEDGTKAAADIYYSHLLFYPYQVYINWTPKEEGNILYNDKKFVTLLYQWNNDYFTEYSKVSDAGSYVKGSIYEFIESSEKVVIVVDCENSDPYKLCATLRNLDRQYTKKISSIILFDDVHAASAWRILESFTAIPVEHMMIERVKQNKSLVDVMLISRTCQEHYKNNVDSFILVSSDSDYWGLISSLQDARFLVMIERESCGPDLKNALSDAGIFYCYIDDFYSGNTEDIKQSALFKEMYRYIDNAVRLNIFEMFDEAIRTTRIEMSSAEKQQFISQYVKTMQMRITDSGDVVLEFKRK